MQKPPFRIEPSMTSAFEALDATVLAAAGATEYVEPLKAVVIGGGTGAPVSIRSLLSLGISTDAVVAMADDGGSTGILREAANVTPPGDIRKCIAAFARNPHDPLVKAFKYRIEIADNHALGNLMLSVLEDACGSFIEAIDICERLLDAQGHVYPSTLNHVTLAATTRDGIVLDGQAAACHSKTALGEVQLRSDDGPITAYSGAIHAIEEADLIILGPGSLFTSVIANILVPGIIDAIRRSSATTLFICSLADAQGETWGLSVKEHVEALLQHGMDGLLDYVLVHSPVHLRPESSGWNAFSAATGADGMYSSTADYEDLQLHNGIRPVRIDYQDLCAIQEMGPVVIARDLADGERPTWHSPAALRNAILQVIKLMSSRK